MKTTADKHRWYTLVCCCTLALVGGLHPAAGELELDWWTVDGGGGPASGGSFELNATVGQCDTGVVGGGPFTISGGYWVVGVCQPGDCDQDGDVDLHDFAGMPACMHGPGGGLGVDCDCYDLDVDGDVDLSDYAQFQQSFTSGV